MASVAHYEAGPVEVHAPFAPAHEKMTGVTHGPGAVEVRGAHGRRAVGRRRSQRELVAVTADSEKRQPWKHRNNPLRTTSTNCRGGLPY